MRLADRQVLVTGGTAGVGLALAERLRERGCDVLVCGRDPARLGPLGPSGVVADLSTPQGVEILVEAVDRRLPELSVLVNNAGIQLNGWWMRQQPHETAQDVATEVHVNLVAPLQLTARLLPRLAARDEAAVVNVTSGLAVVPKRSAPIYCAAKAGLRAFTTALRYQLAADAPHVRAIEVLLPMVDTAMTAGRGSGKISPDQAAQAMIQGIERGRDMIPVGKVRPLLALNRIAPSMAARILRDR